MVSFLENASKDFEVTESVGGFSLNREKNSFDDIYEEAYDQMMAGNSDPIVGIDSFMKNPAKVAAFKNLLIGQLKEECDHMKTESVDDPEKYGTHAKLYDQVSDMFDNCVDDFYKESVRGQLLPIKSLDFPILIKQALKLATNDIMQTETVRTPLVKKHIEQTWVIDPKTKKRWKYPQCFFKKEFLEIYSAGKGLPIKNTKVKLPIYNFDVITKCTDGDVDRDKFTIDLKVEKVYVTDPADGEEIPVIIDPAMRINLSDNTWLGGTIRKTVKKANGDDLVVDDIVMGMVDWDAKTTTMNSAAGMVTAVEFSGFLSNERNERQVKFDYTREEREWKIEDGFRADASFSIEELEDNKALLEIDLYKKTYNSLTELLVQMEDQLNLEFLDKEFEKYKGVELDPLDWNSFVKEDVFDFDSTSITTALPNEYIEKMLKFKIDRFIMDLADTAKMEDMTFVIYGNPRYVSFLDSMVKWISRPGSTMNGVKLDWGYGVLTSNNVKVQVVATKKVNAEYDKTKKVHKGLRIIPYPLSKEQFTFKHYKYTTHIMTSQNSAYRDPELPGGSYNYVVGTSRYTNAAVQGIQAQLGFMNAEQYIHM